MCSEQNSVVVCQKSCKLVHALWRCGQSNTVDSVFWATPHILQHTVKTVTTRLIQTHTVHAVWARVGVLDSITVVYHSMHQLADSHVDISRQCTLTPCNSEKWKRFQFIKQQRTKRPLPLNVFWWVHVNLPEAMNPWLTYFHYTPLLLHASSVHAPFTATSCFLIIQVQTIANLRQHNTRF